MNKLINKSEYLKAKRIVDKYEKQIAKPVIVKKPVISHDVRRLIKAKKKYKIGTKITSLFGADDIICKPTSPFIKNIDSIYIGENHTILANCESGDARMIYMDGNWAKIIK